MSTQYTQAKQSAQELIDQYALTTPIRIFELAKLMGLQWEGCSTEKLCAIVRKKEPEMEKQPNFTSWNEVLAFYDTDDAMIYLNEDGQPITRSRFTFAHEIGHHRLHAHLKENHFRKVTLKNDLYAPQDPKEVEANYFAGYLLMPDAAIERILPYAALMPHHPDYITREFAKMLAVSPESMRIRLQTFRREHPDIWEHHRMDQRIY